MSYELAFIMVGRVIAWGLLVLTPPAAFYIAGEYLGRRQAERGALEFWIGVASYIAVILTRCHGKEHRHE